MPSSWFSPLGDRDLERIHQSALKVLAEVGVRVESRELLGLLADHGGAVEPESDRVRFPVSCVEQFIADSAKYDWNAHRPSFHTFAGIYACLYLNPETDRFEPFTEQTYRDYVRVGNALKEVDGISLLGIPFTCADIPPAYGALAEKLYGWKHHAGVSGTVQFTGLCPYIVEMYERRAAELGRPLRDVFRAVGYLISPLRLARAECEQLLYFRSRGLHMSTGHLLSAGASAPITMAGAVVLSLAESLFLGILGRTLWGSRSFHVGGGPMVMDMRATASMYGRPERIVMTAMLGQLARWYRVGSGSHAGLSDAKEPSVQAGMQKALGIIPGIFACGSSSMDAGLLSIDEVCSPEQLIYDNELAGAVRRTIEPIDLSDEALAFADIAEVGPGGTFIGTDLTAKRFRTELWEPALWARSSVKEWLASGAVTDRQRAKDRIREILAEPEPEPGLSEECERDLRAIIARAVAANAAE
ncbi:MAG: trimethylamine methyltransferase family protein [Armatimonadota bacterium]